MKERGGGKYNKYFLRQLINSEYSIAIIVFLLILITSPLVPHFFTYRNFINVFTRTTIVAMAAIGMTFVIITGGIDLSVGGIVIFSSYVGLRSMLQIVGVDPNIAALSMLATGAIIGSINGFSIVSLGMPPFIATWAMMNIARGLAHLIYEAITVFNLPKYWRFFGTGIIIGIPVPIIMYLIVVIMAHLVLKYSLFGRNIYAVGSNAKAAWLAEVNTKKTIFLAYVISGITAAAAAIILTSRLGAVEGNLASGLELDVISAVIVGGTSLLGGEGTIIGSLIGALIIEFAGNILTLARVSPFFTLVAKGLILWFAVFIDMARKGHVFKKIEI